MPDLIAAIQKSVEFASPQYLVGVPLAVALLLFAGVIHVLQRRSRPVKTHGSSYPFIGHIKFWFVAIVLLALTAVAAARPYFVYGASSFKRGDVEVPVVIDSSASMWVKDIGGMSRLAVAVRETLNLYTHDIITPGDRVALFVFGGTALRKVHLSSDLDRFMDQVSRLAPPPVLTGDAFPWDSAIADALEHVYQSLDSQDRFQAGEEEWTPTKRTDRLVLLLTDGDFTLDALQMQRLDQALVEFQRRGLAVYPIGIGSRMGSDLSEILRDYERGREFDPELEAELLDQRTRLNTESLGLLAQRTGGNVFIVDNPQTNASGFIRGAVESHRNISFQLIPAEDKQEVWQYVVMLAILMFVVAVLVY